jgi:hypothetical protein
MRSLACNELLNKFAIQSTEKQYRLAERIGDRPWSLSLETGKIRFGDDLSWGVQVLGTESYTNATWMWAWANDSLKLPLELVDGAKKVRDFGAHKTVRELENKSFGLDVANGYALATVAVGLVEAHGYYRAPFEDGAVYVLVTDPAFPSVRPPSTAEMVQAVRKAMQSFDLDPPDALAAYAQQRAGRLDREGSRATLVIGDRPRFTAVLDAKEKISRIETHE